jgi:hypothetical protein
MAEDHSRESEEQQRRGHEAEHEPQVSYDLPAPALGEALQAPISLLLGRAKLTGRGASSARTGVVQRAQQAYGNRAVQRFLSAYEKEEGEENELSERIQKASVGGSPIDGSVRDRIEEGVGTSLESVRVHTDGEADKLAAEVESIAFTSGQDIFFRQGMYNPHTPEGLRLLTHEATHTVQQAQGPVEGTPSEGGVSISHPDDKFEQAAERTAEMVAMGLKPNLLEEELMPPWLVGRKAVQRYLLPSTIPDARPPSEGLLEEQAGGLIGGVGSTLGQAYGDIGGMIGSGISDAAGFLGGRYGRGATRLGGLGARGGAAVGDAVSGAAGMFGRGASRIGSFVGGNVSRIEGMLGVGTGIGAGIEGAGNFIGDTAASAGGFADDLITQGAAAAGGLFGSVGTMAGDAFSAAGNFFGGNISRNTRRMGDTAAGVASDIGGFVSGFDPSLLLM